MAVGGEGRKGSRGNKRKVKKKLLKFPEAGIKTVIPNLKKNMVMCPLEPINDAAVVLKSPLSLLV